MIARDNDLGRWQRVEKAPRGREFDGPRALGEIAGDHDKIRFDPRHQRDQRFEERGVDTSEVKIR
jgi:hypothetical protein